MHILSFICINHERLFGAPSDGASMRFESQAKSTREGGIRTLEARFVFGGPALGLPALLSHPFSRHQDGRVVKALDLSSNGRKSSWVRTPLLVSGFWTRACDRCKYEFCCHRQKSSQFVLWLKITLFHLKVLPQVCRPINGTVFSLLQRRIWLGSWKYLFWIFIER